MLHSIEQTVSEEYWKQKFLHSIANNQLQPFADKAIQGNDQTRIEELAIGLDADEHEQILKRCNQSEMLIYTYYLSIIKVLFYRYGQAEEIIVGGGALRELVNDSDDALLLFYSSKLHNDMTFKEVFSALKEELIDAYKHQFLTVDNLQDVFDGSQSENLRKVGFFTDHVVSGSQLKHQFEFCMTISQKADKASLSIAFDALKYSSALVMSFLKNFKKLVKSISAGLYDPIATLDIIDEQFVTQLEKEFNNTTTGYSENTTLYTLFERSAQTHANRQALICGGEAMTYEALLNAATAVANLLVSKGLEAGQNVGLLSGRNFDMVIGMLAIMRAGCTYVPIDPKYPVERQNYILSNSGIEWLLVDDDNTAEATADAYQRIAISEGVQYEGEIFESKGAADDLAYIIYTSGSTGQPKGVMISHFSAVNLVEWINDKFSVNQEDRLLMLSSMCFDLSVYDIYGALFSGAALVIIDEERIKDPDLLMETLQEEQVTIWNSVPSTMNHIVKYYEAFGFNQTQDALRVVLMSGDWIPVSLSPKISKVFPNAEPISLGGATEGTVWSNFYPIGDVDQTWRSIPYGRPLGNNTFYIMDEQLKPVPHGAMGELVIGGLGVAQGYFNDPEKTKNAFVSDPFSERAGAMMYKTGDLGRMRSDWNMEILGRKDYQVKIRGFRVETGEIENVLLLMEGITDVVVVDRQNEEGTKYLVAYYVSDRTMTNNEIKDFLANYLTDYMIPSYFMKLDALPLSGNGKIDRKSLPDVSTATADIVAPANTIEENLKSIWTEQLGVAEISTTDDFFEIGGNSLFATRIISEIYSQYQVRLGLEKLFDHSTIQTLAAYIANKSPLENDDIPQLPQQESYDLSHDQRRIWVLSQLDEGSVAYNIPGTYTLIGRLNTDVFFQALEEVVKRHEILRTSFELKDLTPQQIVHAFDRDQCHFTFIDHSDGNVSEDALRKVLKDSVNEPFNLAEGYLLRVLLVKISEEEYKLAVTFHHIIADLITLQVFNNELIGFYDTLLKDEEKNIEPLKVHYKDYAAWRNAKIQNGVFDKDKQYWLEQLGEMVPPVELPYDFPKDEHRNMYQGHTLQLSIDQDTLRELDEVIRERNITFYMVFITVVNALLYKYHQQEYITLGTPVSGRDHPDLTNQLGIYLDTVAVRNQIAEDDTFDQLLATVKRNVLNAIAHQRYPYDLVVKNLAEKHGTKDAQLFNVLLSYAEQFDTAEDQSDKLQVSDYVIDNQSAKFDLSFMFFNDGEQITCDIEYDLSLFELSTIKMMKTHFAQLLETFIKQPETLLKDLATSVSGNLQVEEREDLPFDF